MWYDGSRTKHKEKVEMEKGSREIGSFFKLVVTRRRIDRRKLAVRLGFEYSDNERMICAYFAKEDRLWRESEVERWCEVLGISKSEELKAKAGRKDLNGKC